MLISLGEDILFLICDYLEYTDQAILSKVCQYLKEFMENIFWKFTYKKGLKLAKANAKYMERLELNSEDLDKYVIARKEVELPNLKSISFYQNPNENHTHRLLELAGLFPNIQRLIYEGTFDERHFLFFDNLEILKFTLCQREIDFSTIFQSPKLRSIFFRCEGYFDELDEDCLYRSYVQAARTCSTLEEVGVDYKYLHEEILDGLAEIRNLNAISIDASEFFEDLAWNLHQSSLAMEMEPWLDRIDQRISVNSLRRLIIQRNFRISYTYFRILSPSNLHEIYFLYCSQQDEEALRVEHGEYSCYYSDESSEVRAYNFVELINHCPHLQLLDLSGNYITKNFVAHIARAIKFEERRQPLLLRCYGTDITEHCMQDLQLPNKLLVSFDEVFYDFEDAYSNCFFHIKLNGI